MDIDISDQSPDNANKWRLYNNTLVTSASISIVLIRAFPNDTFTLRYEINS